MPHTLTVYLTDHGPAGHAFIGLTDEHGKSEYWGYYPHAADICIPPETPGGEAHIEERHGFFGRGIGHGELRDDTCAITEHYNLTPSNPIPLSDEKYEQLHNYIQQVHDSPGYYIIAGGNCVDFVNHALHEAGEKINISGLFTIEQLEHNNLTGKYIEAVYRSNVPPTGAPNGGDPDHIPGKGEWAAGQNWSHAPEPIYIPVPVDMSLNAPADEHSIADQIKEAFGSSSGHDAHTGGNAGNSNTNGDGILHLGDLDYIGGAHDDSTYIPSVVQENIHGLHIDPADDTSTSDHATGLYTHMDPLSYTTDIDPADAALQNEAIIQGPASEIMLQENSGILSRISDYIHDVIDKSALFEGSSNDGNNNNHDAQYIAGTTDPDQYPHNTHSVQVNDVFTATETIDNGSGWGSDLHTHDAPTVQNEPASASITETGGFLSDLLGLDPHAHDSATVQNEAALAPTIETGGFWGSDPHMHDAPSIPVNDISASAPATETGAGWGWGSDSYTQETPSVPVDDVSASEPITEKGSFWSNLFGADSHAHDSITVQNEIASAPTTETGSGWGWGSDSHSHDTPSVPVTDISTSAPTTETGSGWGWGSDSHTHDTPSMQVNDVPTSMPGMDTGTSW